MNKLAAAVAAVVFALPGLTSAQFANRAHQSVLSGMHEKDEGRPGYGGSTQPHDMKEHGPYGPHRHRLSTIIVYVPAVGSVSAPYYYAPTAPLYIERDPPAYAYRDASGFYYWCPDPAGYYPDQVDCPIGWRLVAP